MMVTEYLMGKNQTNYEITDAYHFKCVFWFSCVIYATFLFRNSVVI